MSDHWYHCPSLHVGENTLPAVEAHHALRVMRVRGGDSLTLFDGAGNVGVGVARVDSGGEAQRVFKKARSLFVDVAEMTAHAPPKPTLTIVTAACKGPRMTMLVEKCTELGVTRIVVADFARSVVRMSDNGVEKLQRTALEACKQARRPWLPEISTHRDGVRLITEIAKDSDNLIFIAHPTPKVRTLADEIQEFEKTATITIAIGPEGGFADSEVDAMLKAGARAVALTPSILRVETAAICAASVVMCHD